MKLDNKYFPVFMLGVAIFALIIIVWSSLNHRQKAYDRFVESASTNDSLLTQTLSVVESDDELSLNTFSGKKVIVVFWSSWSDKSKLMLEELSAFKDQTTNLEIVASVVKDATDSFELADFPPNLVYVDGASLFNQLKVPGIPSYIILNENGDYLYAHVGYQQGAGYRIVEEQIGK